MRPVVLSGMSTAYVELLLNKTRYTGVLHQAQQSSTDGLIAGWLSKVFVYRRLQGIQKHTFWHTAPSCGQQTAAKVDGQLQSSPPERRAANARFASTAENAVWQSQHSLSLVSLLSFTP